MSNLPSFPWGSMPCEPPLEIPDWTVTWWHNEADRMYGFLAISDAAFLGPFGYQSVVSEDFVASPNASKMLRDVLQWERMRSMERRAEDVQKALLPPREP